ncbi:MULTISPECIES: prepilin peptidase [unclassified Vibrio]|uniref:prepilin peptidase n=1 Tax=unclassified Vibrio TaxID=2614977 RepID=UPI001EF13C58|nr:MULTISPECIES: prepilin peptidase [unclassified Vibrio]
MLLLVTLIILILIVIGDFCQRTIHHHYLQALTVVILLGWLTQPNWSILPYTLVILAVGCVLFYFRLLAAGDTKLLAVLSLGIHPDYLPLTIVGITVIGGIMALGYLLYGLCTDLTVVCQKGIPYGVPISLVGGCAIYLSSL